MDYVRPASFNASQVHIHHTYDERLSLMQTTTEFRRFPKNTWRLVRLRERHLSLRFNEDMEEVHQQHQQQLRYTNQALRLKKSTDQLRSQLMENLNALDNYGAEKKQQQQHSLLDLSLCAKRVDDQSSISSLPSLTSQSTVSPMSPAMAEFSFQTPVRIDDHHTPTKFSH